MLKALIKKELLSLYSSLAINRKTGKLRSKGGRIGMGVLMGLVYLSVAFAFVGVSEQLTDAFLMLKLDGLYFSLMAVFMLLLGVFGSVFVTYSSLYKPKDNELLLAMPIPPRTILLSRMFDVALMSLLFESLVWIPTLVIYFIKTGLRIKVLLCGLGVFAAVSVLVLAITCLLAWVVALIASRIRNKNVVTTVMTVLALGLYYYFCGRMNEYLDSLASMGTLLSGIIENNTFLIYHLGRAVLGETQSLLFVFGIALVLGIVTWLLLSRTFLGLTKTKGSDRRLIKEKIAPQKSRSASKALFARELKHFTQSPAYMLNTGLGLVMLIAGGVILLIKAGDITPLLNLLTAEFPQARAYIAAGLCGVMMLLACTITISAPSVSLEGKNLWILQTMPVDAKKILQSKHMLHMLLAVPCMLFLNIAFAIVFGLGFAEIALCLLMSVGFTEFICVFGLWLDIRHANLTWTNETAVIKQSIPVVICMLGGWGFTAALGVLCWLVRNVIPPMTYVRIVCALILCADVLLNRLVDTKGARIFRTL